MAKFKASFSPNTKVSITEYKDDCFKTTVSYQEKPYDSCTSPNRFKAEEECMRILNDIGLEGETADQVEELISLDGQMKIVRGMRANTTVNLFLS